MLITITPGMWLLINLLIENAIAAILDRVSAMTPEEVAAEIPIAEAEKAKLLEKLNSH